MMGNATSGHCGIHALATWAQARGPLSHHYSAATKVVTDEHALCSQTMGPIRMGTHSTGVTDHTPALLGLPDTTSPSPTLAQVSVSHLLGELHPEFLLKTGPLFPYFIYSCSLQITRLCCLSPGRPLHLSGDSTVGSSTQHSYKLLSR